MATFGTIEPFDMKPASWLAYEDRIELFLEANSVDDDKKVSTFLSLVGPECYNLVKTLCSPEKPSDKTVTELFVIIREHFCPKKIVIAERYRFHNGKQTKGENIAAYVTKLKKLSENCQFGDFLSEMLRDRFVCGLKDQATLQRLLTEEDLTFQSAVSISTTMEAVAKDSKELYQPNRQQSAGGKSKGDGPPQKGQFPKGGGTPQQGQFSKGGGPPQQGQFPKGGGPPQQGQFAKGAGPYPLMGGGPPMSGGPYPLGQIPMGDGPYPLGQIPRGDGPYPLGQIPRGDGPYPLGQIPKGGGPYPLGQFPKGGGPPIQGQFPKGGGPPQQPQGSPQKACYHCGGHKHAADTCYHKNAKCTECGKHGHIEKACKAKGKGGKPKGNPGQQKAGQGKKGGPVQPAKLPYGVEESGQQGHRKTAQSH